MTHEAINVVGCSKCAFLQDCGGIKETTLFDWGCYSQCVLNCNPGICDLTCPNNPQLFMERMKEIGGTFRFSSPPMKIPRINLPQYVPKIHNGSGRFIPLRERYTAIPVRELLSKSGNQASCRFENSDQMRKHFCLSDKTVYIISCIAEDDDIELLWNGLRYGKIANEFAALNAAAIIVPNFSFFVNDVPRMHTIYNRKRICLAGRILSDAGCRIILTLNALTSDDWDFWYELLRENPSIKYVAKEFQTGSSAPIPAKLTIENLAKVQDRLGRPLHPIALGSGRYNEILRSHFHTYSVLDSRPFLLATKRRRAINVSPDSYSEVFSPTAPDESIDEFLHWNIKARKARFK